MKDIKSREDIKLLVDTFYTYVQQNEGLDAIFNGFAHVDWETHLPKMYDFWETILFHKNLYKGAPMPVHVKMSTETSFTKQNFADWVALFKKTVDELFEGQNAHTIKTRAESIAMIMQMKVKMA